MKLSTVNLIYFSPTGTSEKIVKAIGQELGAKQINEFDITPLAFASSENLKIESELSIIAIPVYGGRVPEQALENLKKFEVKNAPVVLVAVYGNRDFDDALLELKDFVLEIGFTPFAAAAFIGEHSFSIDSKPIAKNRPDNPDLLKAKQFGEELLLKIQDGEVNGFKVCDVPGNIPYKAKGKMPDIAPTTKEELCDLCGICADVCPVDVIVVADKVVTNAEACIRCCACIKACPKGARVFDIPLIDGIRDKLFANCSERKEPEFFI
ncbi:4Fe-4S binding protein [Labilibaculum antarcticum]|uniref:4Fe-4S ferredoxin n=1 Tax=Labilibaculum antarcticum TaxID=1717717 RepID=A0A1Y1CLD1_9BACT|nr:4Fe-4S binding protein [Labilibaculum antarcticum]BAX81155.1 4Fe-4S ferredoxin [Labilibaculum antarcticum]